LWDQALATNILAKKNQSNYQNQEINIYFLTREQEPCSQSQRERFEE